MAEGPTNFISREMRFPHLQGLQHDAKIVAMGDSKM